MKKKNGTTVIANDKNANVLNLVMRISMITIDKIHHLKQSAAPRHRRRRRWPDTAGTCCAAAGMWASAPNLGAMQRGAVISTYPYPVRRGPRPGVPRTAGRACCRQPSAVNKMNFCFFFVCLTCKNNISPTSRPPVRRRSGPGRSVPAVQVVPPPRPQWPLHPGCAAARHCDEMVVQRVQPNVHDDAEKLGDGAEEAYGGLAILVGKLLVADDEGAFSRAQVHEVARGRHTHRPVYDCHITSLACVRVNVRAQRNDHVCLAALLLRRVHDGVLEKVAEVDHDVPVSQTKKSAACHLVSVTHT